MHVLHLDHLVLTVKSIEDTCRFYETVLGMERQTFGQGRVALKFGQHKINLHEAGKEFEPKAHCATPGSADLCFIVSDLNEAENSIRQAGVDILAGPVQRSGATGPITSLYFRDLDGNLLEVATIN